MNGLQLSIISRFLLLFSHASFLQTVCRSLSYAHGLTFALYSKYNENCLIMFNHLSLCLLLCSLFLSAVLTTVECVWHLMHSSATFQMEWDRPSSLDDRRWPQHPWVRENFSLFIRATRAQQQFNYSQLDLLLNIKNTNKSNTCTPVFSPIQVILRLV